MVAAGKDAPRRHTGLQRHLGGEHGGVGAATNAVSAEIFARHVYNPDLRSTRLSLAYLTLALKDRYYCPRSRRSLDFQGAFRGPGAWVRT